jgi:hypothetical protein
MSARPLLVAALCLAATNATATAQAPVDLTGTWVMNTAKSVSAGEPPAKSRSWVYARSGSAYQHTQTADHGDGPETRAVQFPIGAGTASTTLPNGMTMRYEVQQHADTVIFLLDYSFEGQGVVATETGRITLSKDGRILTYVSDMLQGGDIAHRAWIFDKKPAA